MAKMSARQKRAANRRRQRDVKVEVVPPRVVEEDVTTLYWATPKVWSRRCSLCGHKGCEVYCHFDQSSLCGLCAERLSVEVRESRAARRAARL